MSEHRDPVEIERWKPDLYRKYVETERRLGFTLSPSRRTLSQITGIDA